MSDNVKHGAEGFNTDDNCDDDSTDTAGDGCCNDEADMTPESTPDSGATGAVAVITWLSLPDCDVGCSSVWMKGILLARPAVEMVVV